MASTEEYELQRLYEQLNKAKARRKKEQASKSHRRRCIVAFKRHILDEGFSLSLDSILKELNVDAVTYCDVILQKLKFFMGGYKATHDTVAVREMLKRMRRKAVVAADAAV